MIKGVRLTTGVEFADRDAPPSPVQLARDEPLARELFPLAERLEPEPWMGRRPCLPDMVPVIGKGERHQGLWFAFGHAHHGFTLGPATGRRRDDDWEGALHRPVVLRRQPVRCQLKIPSRRPPFFELRTGPWPTAWHAAR